MIKATLRPLWLAGAGLVLATGLSACGDPEPDAAPVENAAFEEDSAPPVEAVTPVPEPEPMPSENLSVVEEEALPPSAPVEPDAQVLDDASATGMTSRSTRDEAEPVPPVTPGPALPENATN